MELDSEPLCVGWEQMQTFVGPKGGSQSPHGTTVLALEMSSADYDRRYTLLAARHCMKEPRNYRGLHRGFLVVRNVGTTEVYETWMARHVFLRNYMPAAIQRCSAVDRVGPPSGTVPF